METLQLDYFWGLRRFSLDFFIWDIIVMYYKQNFIYAFVDTDKNLLIKNYSNSGF